MGSECTNFQTLMIYIGMGAFLLGFVMFGYWFAEQEIIRKTRRDYEALKEHGFPSRMEGKDFSDVRRKAIERPYDDKAIWNQVEEHHTGLRKDAGFFGGLLGFAVLGVIKLLFWAFD